MSLGLFSLDYKQGINQSDCRRNILSLSPCNIFFLRLNILLFTLSQILSMCHGSCVKY
jgi:hypothetical protein